MEKVGPGEMGGRAKGHIAGNWQSWELNAAVCLQEAHALNHCVPPPSMWSLLSSGLNLAPLPIQDPVSQVCLLCPSRWISPSLWETHTLETSQEALLRGRGTQGPGGGLGGREKVQHHRPAFLSPQQALRARATASPGAGGEGAGPSQEASLGPPLPAPPAPPAAQVHPKASPEGG